MHHHSTNTFATVIPASVWICSKYHPLESPSMSILVFISQSHSSVNARRPKISNTVIRRKEASPEMKRMSELGLGYTRTELRGTSLRLSCRLGLKSHSAEAVEAMLKLPFHWLTRPLADTCISPTYDSSNASKTYQVPADNWVWELLSYNTIVPLLRLCTTHNNCDSWPRAWVRWKDHRASLPNDTGQ